MRARTGRPQKIVWEKGEKERQSEEHRSLGLEDLLIFFRQPPADKTPGKVPAQHPGQPEQQQGTGDYCGEGEEKGRPCSKENTARGSGNIAGDRSQHDREKLEQEKTQVGVWRKVVNVGPQGFLRGRRLEKAGGV